MQQTSVLDTSLGTGEAMRQEAPLHIEGPYRHGSKFRCRLRTAEGRRWLPAADTIEAALAAAQQAVQLPPDPHVEANEPEEEQEAVGAAPESDRQRADPGGVRILGPYRHEGAWRCRIVTSAGRSWAPTAATETAALQGAEKQAATLARQGSITICDSISNAIITRQQDIFGLLYG